MPILKIRRAEERGTAEHGWLHARFTFSFAGYYEPEHCGFHSLIVMNNDIIRIDTSVSAALQLSPDLDRIARAQNFVEDGKIDARRD